jgi:S1-C subfamily serine protease
VLEAAAVKIRIAVVSVLVLALGAWLTPRAAQTTMTAPDQSAAPLFAEQVQLRESSGPFVGVQDVAADAGVYSVVIPALDSPRAAILSDFSEASDTPFTPAGFGVFVSDRHVLTHSLALAGRASVRLTLSTDAMVDARVAAYEPATGLVLLETDASGRAPAPLALEDPSVGALAVGVGRSIEGDFAAPVFVTRSAAGRYAIGANDTILPGLPVFTLEGELFAVAAPGDRETRAIPVRGAAERLIARAAAGEQLSSFGVALQAIDGSLTGAFGENGVVVTDLVEGGPADLADLLVGDVLLAVGGVDVGSPEEAMRLLGSAPVDEPARLRIRRAGRVRDIEVTPAPAYAVAALARARPPATTPDARSVLPADVLQMYAIAPSARVLSVSGRAVSSRAQLQRELRAARATVPVLLEQGRSRFFVGVEPVR